MRVVFDIETNGLLPELDTITALVIKNIDGGKVYSCHNQPHASLTIEDGLDMLRHCKMIVAHNSIRFDIPAIRKVFPEWETSATVRDTLLLSRLQYPEIRTKDEVLSHRGKLPAKLIGRHSLEAWGHRLGLHKGTYSGGWDTWSQDLQDYCEQDTEVLFKLWHTLQKNLYAEAAVDMEHRFATIIQAQEKQGWPFDEAEAIKLYSRLLHRRNELEEGLEEVFPARVVDMKSQWWEDILTGKVYGTKKEGSEDGVAASALQRGPFKTKTIPFNPGSRDEIARRLIEKYNWKPTRFTPNGKPQIDETVLGELVFPEAKVMAEYFLLQKRIGQLAEGSKAWLKLVKVGEDGIPRIHGSMNTVGAVTRRCTHRDPNVSQVPASSKPYGKECRSLFTTPPGYLLVGADAGQLELRCLAHYLAPYDNGAYTTIVTTGDVHTVNQEAAGLPTRDSAKTFIYALLYGAGSAKMGSIIGKGSRAGAQMKKKFFAAMPSFRMLTAALDRRLDTLQPIRAIDGGALTIRSKHSALNTLLQSAGAIAVKTATVIFHESCEEAGLEWGKDYWIAGHIHDEIQIITKEGLEDDIGDCAVNSIREAGVHLGMRCPLDAAYKVGRTWADTH